MAETSAVIWDNCESFRKKAGTENSKIERLETPDTVDRSIKRGNEQLVSATLLGKTAFMA